MEADSKYMQRCLELAALAKSKDKTAVGSILVLKDEIVAEAEEGEKDLPQLMAHAENIAILRAVEKLGRKDLSDCVLYTTVEPCFMCAYLIRNVRIKKVVYATETPAGGDSSAYPILRDSNIKNWGNPPEIIRGLMRVEAERLLKK